MIDPSDQEPQFHPLEYQVPVDQLGYELELADSFRNQFPDQAPVMDEALTELKRFSGFDIPKYKIDPEQHDEAAARGMVDEAGFLNLGGEQLFAHLMLQMPIDRTPQEIAAMSDAEKTEAGGADDGMLIIGEVPASTQALLNGIYELVGAKVVRDDREVGQRQGDVIREGEYQGEKIYIAEGYFDQCPWYGGKDTLSIRLMGVKHADVVLHMLNRQEFAQLSQVLGKKPWETQDFIVENNIDNRNLAQTIDVLRQTQGIVDASETSVARETLGDTIDQVFEDLDIRVEGDPRAAKLDRSLLPNIELDENNNIKLPSVRKLKRLRTVARRLGRITGN